jgi:hypothetical protein
MFVRAKLKQTNIILFDFFIEKLFWKKIGSSEIGIAVSKISLFTKHIFIGLLSLLMQTISE